MTLHIKKKENEPEKKRPFHYYIDSDLFTWPIPKHGRLFLFQFLSIQIFYVGTSKMSWQTDWTVIFALVFFSLETFKVKPNPYSKASKHAFWWRDVSVERGKGKRNDSEINILVLISRLSIIVVIFSKSLTMEEIWCLVNGHIASVMLYELWF